MAIFALAVACHLAACTPPSRTRVPTAHSPALAPPSAGPSSCSKGDATVYSNKLAGHATASGEVYDPTALTAAHRSLPFGSRVRVVWHGKSVVVRINDRGPFTAGTVIDLSHAAAEELGFVAAGRSAVRVCRVAGF